MSPLAHGTQNIADLWGPSCLQGNVSAGSTRKLSQEINLHPPHHHPNALRQPVASWGSFILFAPRWLQDGDSAKGRRLEIPGVLVDTSLEHTHIGWWLPGSQGLCRG